MFALRAGSGWSPERRVCAGALERVGVPEYDVLIAGASFAGIAVARALLEGGGTGSRVLLVDRKPVGEGQTSACAAPVGLVRRMGAGASILQEHDHLVFHTPTGSLRWTLPDPFCTFEYRRFCHDALAGLNLEVEVLPVAGVEGQDVLTPRGRLRARFLVDCTGWRSVLARSLRSPPSPWLALGVETEVPYQMPPGLHFYFLPEVRAGYAWAFPCGGTVRFGVLRYFGKGRGLAPRLPGERKLLHVLEEFLKRFGLRPSSTIHGGFLRGGLHPPVRDRLFLVGDAAGHCLPLSGEGIRTAVQAGWMCGTLLREVLVGRLDVETAKAVYSGFIARQRLRYAVLGGMEALVRILSPRAIGLLLRATRWPFLQQAFLHHYFALFQEDSLSPRGPINEVNPGSAKAAGAGRGSRTPKGLGPSGF